MSRNWTPTDLRLYAMKRNPIPIDKFKVKAEHVAEKALHEQCIQWLRLHGVRAIVHSRMDKKTSQACGVSDLLFAVIGQAVAIELKVGDNQPTEAQRLFLADCLADGWITGVAYSLDQVVALYNKALERNHEKTH